MSRVAKLTFGASVLLSGLIIYGVHLQQHTERENMFLGVLRDEERLATKRREREQRQDEFEEQNRRRAYLETIQPVSNPTARKNDPPVKPLSSEKARFEGCKTC